MRRLCAIAAALLFAAGCSRQDAEVLGRIGAKVSERAGKLLTDEPNGKLVRSLPLLQPPASVPKADEPAAKDGTRLNMP